MRAIAERLSLAVLALAASVVVAQVPTGDPHHPGGPVPGPQAAMPMPDAAAPGGQPGPMGADMGRMMEIMRPMMAERAGMGHAPGSFPLRSRL